MTDQTPRDVLRLAKAGDIAGAIRHGEVILARRGDAALAMFVGMLHCRQGSFAAGLAHLRRAAAAMPGEAMPRIQLARPLWSAGRYNPATEVARLIPQDYKIRTKRTKKGSFCVISATRSRKISR